ncbi:hypothetical protein NXX53_06010 [Bacteroides salyersiae]|uniref:hypothetical protein n=1 Tax=Bacteroides sp. TaxID=29523 RepID=UPI0025BEBF30|nr:hypothetical protein [Bacteroides sp.]MCS2956829.1 hypothetical protein [Bacteroides salyersiae]
MKKLSRKTIERTIYIVLIVALVVYGMLKDSEAAANLLKAITEAFTLLIQN